MRTIFKLTVMTALFLALVVTPALAKKAPVERVVVDGVTVAQVRPASQMSPYYPAAARVSKRFAEVVLAVQVNGDGRVGNVSLINVSSPDFGFEGSAMDAVRSWRFLPAMENGNAIDSTTVIRISFSPPTLRAPSGFVMSAVSTRPFAAVTPGSYTDRTFIDGYRTENHNQPRLSVAKLPPCSPRTKGQCLYDRAQLSYSEFSEPRHEPTVPPTNSTPLRGGGSRNR